MVMFEKRVKQEPFEGKDRRGGVRKIKRVVPSKDLSLILWALVIGIILFISL